MTETNRVSDKLLKILKSDYFFKIILVIFVVQALWLVFTSAYPMPFDEDFHLGMIRLYASHISPFWSKQPRGADMFGAVARDPSYLYQYLMSFPYRFITLFTNKQSEVVIFLRLINVALFTWGLYLFKKLLLKTGAELHKVNFSLLVFILIPVVPLLAAQVNYDNLLFPATALTFIIAINLTDKLFKKQIDTVLLALLTIAILITCIIKYAYLPIAFIIALYVLFEIHKNIGFNKKLLKLIKKDWLKVGTAKKLALVLGVLLSLVLFSQRYLVNIVEYHSPIPDCSKVLTFNQCREYGPWIRNYNYKLNKVDSDDGKEKDIITFAADWFYGMWLRTYFTLGGPNVLYETRGPLTIPAISAIVFAVSGLVAALFYFKKILNRYNTHHILFLLLAAAFYALALALDDYKQFVQTGQPVAINGRYIFPILLPIILILVMGLTIALRKRTLLKASIGTLAILCSIWGGGALTYIIRSNPSWYWDSRVVRNANHAVQKVLDPIVPGSDKPVEYL